MSNTTNRSEYRFWLRTCVSSAEYEHLYNMHLYILYIRLWCVWREKVLRRFSERFTLNNEERVLWHASRYRYVLRTAKAFAWENNNNITYIYIYGIFGRFLIIIISEPGIPRYIRNNIIRSFGSTENEKIY